MNTRAVLRFLFLLTLFGCGDDDTTMDVGVVAMDASMDVGPGDTSVDAARMDVEPLDSAVAPDARDAAIPPDAGTDVGPADMGMDSREPEPTSCTPMPPSTETNPLGIAPCTLDTPIGGAFGDLFDLRIAASDEFVYLTWRSGRARYRVVPGATCVLERDDGSLPATGRVVDVDQDGTVYWADGLALSWSGTRTGTIDLPDLFSWTTTSDGAGVVYAPQSHLGSPTGVLRVDTHAGTYEPLMGAPERTRSVMATAEGLVLGVSRENCIIEALDSDGARRWCSSSEADMSIGPLGPMAACGAMGGLCMLDRNDPHILLVFGDDGSLLNRLSRWELDVSFDDFDTTPDGTHTYYGSGQGTHDCDSDTDRQLFLYRSSR